MDKAGLLVFLDDQWVWRCDKFKGLSYQDRKKEVKKKSLCIMCLQSGHLARTCPKIHFRCQTDGCNRDHNTLLHPPSTDPSASYDNQNQQNQRKPESNTTSDTSSATIKDNGTAVTATTGVAVK